MPVVPQRAEVARVMALMEGTLPLAAQLLYGSGLRIMEALRLRVKDIDFEMKAVTVRSGKGDQDRVTTLSTSMTPSLKNHVAKVKALHEADLAPGYGEVYLLHALVRTYPGQAASGVGSMFFLPTIFRRTLAPGWSGAIM